MAALLMGAALFVPTATELAFAAGQRVLVVVNDFPITDRDISQRLKLDRATGRSSGSKAQRRKKTLKTLIDEIIARSEAKKLGMKFDKKRIDETVAQLAKGSKTTVDGLKSQLKKKGVSFSTLRAQVEATLILRAIISRNLKTKIEVSDAELDKRYASISSDPRLRPVTVYLIREIDLPVGKVSEAMRQQLEYARAIEAQQIAAKYKGCKSLKKAAKGIFNVKISRMVQAPADKMPKQMKAVLKKAGTGRLIGPMRGPSGVRMIAYCGRQTIKPPKPPREVIKNMMLNDKFDKAADRVMRSLRRRALIEYKDKSAVLTQ